MEKLSYASLFPVLYITFFYIQNNSKYLRCKATKYYKLEESRKSNFRPWLKTTFFPEYVLKSS